jgi:hypothetical protein
VSASTAKVERGSASVSVKGFVLTGSGLSTGAGPEAPPPELSPAEPFDGVLETAPLPPLDTVPEPALDECPEPPEPPLPCVGGLVLAVPPVPVLVPGRPALPPLLGPLMFELEPPAPGVELLFVPGGALVAAPESSSSPPQPTNASPSANTPNQVKCFAIRPHLRKSPPPTTGNPAALQQGVCRRGTPGENRANSRE